jgi:hypothetical protein
MASAVIDRAEFWEFKARCSELDLELAKMRAIGEMLAAKKNALVEAFARRHALDPAQPITLDDVAYTATQEDA